ncbi:hypothetical protein SADUNF_Sadunf16G0292000 [Salix dunnii]|uniref:AAA+ ATPase domain-containing protein n=1 Tax=Salix dunnii TaxID=1413687 RepID=A0A835JEH7_9ROSI|nr:hypothetical protein SADUNF_Sadunf16G0292000 [Salix dunnii]
MAIESVGGSLVSKIAELLAEPVKKQFRYMFSFDNFVQEFNEQARSLVWAIYHLQVEVDVATKNAEEIEIYVNPWLEDAKKALALYGLQDAVNVATKNAEEIESDVNKWLEDAKNKMEGVNRLENENGKCFTWCPKWIHQFKLSKALEKKTETLRKLEEKSKKFQKVSHKAPLQDIEFLLSKEFTPSESSKEAFEQIMKALKDDNVNMIGLYGMGGVGKTTLVKEIGRIAKETQLFDDVLLATVSQNPNVMYMQDRMEESLDLRFDEKTKEGRANRLWQRLKTKKKLLVILDDVWKVINLKQIGIPFGDDHMGCKVLLTTRLRGVCSLMKCQQQVLLSILSENEAWALFKINAGLRDEDSNLNTVAKEVARECQGLPIALVSVGRALRDKSTVEWEQASKDLKNSQFQHMELTEDYNIPIEDLTRYAVGYELHQDVESIEDARKQVYVEIKTLKDCCMLLGTETEEKVKMHDLVRDVAIQIASSKEHGFMVKAGIGLKEWPMRNKSFEGCTTISLMGNKLAELPEGLVCPQLKVLLLELDNDLKVPERFFEGMKEIEVLSLSGGCLSLQSLEFSMDLQSLQLIACKCNDFIWLRKMQRLKILGFIGCSSLEELPDEIGELKELRLLDMTYCSSLRRIPVNLIGRLKKLEELLIGGDSFEDWGVVGCDSTGGMNASLTELNLLSHLAILSLKIPRIECIPRDFVFPRLLKYDIVLGDGYVETKLPTSTRLYLTNINAASLNAKTFEQLFPTVSQIGFRNIKGLENIALFCDQMTSYGHGSQKDFLQRLEDVEMYSCRDSRTLLPVKWRQALNNLISVEIHDCQSLEDVFELGEAVEGIKEELRLLSSLTRLVLLWLPELKCIWKGPTKHVSLRSLVHLELRGLDKLTFIFTPHLAQSLHHLETLEIEHCSGLKHLIREKDEEREIIPDSLGFPKLKTISISDCDKLEYVFLVSVSPSLQKLKKITIGYGCNLKQIFYIGEGDAHTRDGIINFPRLRELSLLSGCSFFGPKNFTAQLPSLQELAIEGHEGMGDLLAQLQGFTNLIEIEITSCNAGQHLFQAGSFVPSRRSGDQWLQAVKNLKIENCESLEEVFELGEAVEGIKEELRLLSCLTRLVLRRLPELKCIWKGPTRHASLRSVVHLELQSLDKLIFIFTPHLAQSFDHLETLEIGHCSGLKHLIREKDEEREIIPDSLGFPKLKTLSISGCDKLEYLFPVSVSPSLQELKNITIGYGCNLKQIFYIGEGDAHTRDGIINFPRLRKLSLLSGCSFFGPKNFTAQLPSLQELAIEGHEGMGDLLAQLQGFTNLIEIEITSCNAGQHLFQAGSFVHSRRSGDQWLQAVKNLKIENCESLEEGPTKHVSLRSLVHLELWSLDKLTFIFTLHLAQSLDHLETLEIGHCSELKHLIREKDDEREIIPDSLGFPKLKTLSISGCDKLEYVFPVSVSQSLLNLQEMTIALGANLKQIFYSGEGDTLTKDGVINFPQLRKLSLSIPKNFTAQLPSLQDLAIEGHNELGDFLAQLQEKLYCMPDMRCIWKGLVLSHLTTLEVEISACNKLRSLFPVAMASGLPKLQRLEVANSSQLLGVFGQDDHASPVNVEKQMVFPNLSFLRLYKLPSIVCFSRGCDDFLFPLMVVLKVDKCSKLTTTFANKTNVSMSAQYLKVAEDSSTGCSEP